MGNPIDLQCTDRELIADLFTRYYTDVTPGWIWVLEFRGRLVGYLMGCPDTKLFQKYMDDVYPSILLGVLRRGSLFRSGSAGFLWRTIGDILGKVLRREPLEYYNPAFPAHAHLNVLPEGRSSTYQLAARFLKQPRQHNVPGIMVEIWAENAHMATLLEHHRFQKVHSTTMPGMRQSNGYPYHVATYVRSLL